MLIHFHERLLVIRLGQSNNTAYFITFFGHEQTFEHYTTSQNRLIMVCIVTHRGEGVDLWCTFSLEEREFRTLTVWQSRYYD